MFLAIGFGVAAGASALATLSATAHGISLGADFSEFQNSVFYAVPKKQRKYLPDEHRKMDGILLTYKELELLREFGDPGGHTPVLNGYPNETPETVFERGANRVIRFAPFIALMGQRDDA